MGNIWSLSGIIADTIEKTTLSKYVSLHRQTNVQLVQNVLLVWLDRNIDSKNPDCRNTINQLKRVVNTIHKSTDAEQCIKYLASMGDEKACMIISGSLGKEIVPRIHHMPQVDSIFIFCRSKEQHEKWAKHWSKIKGVFTAILPICDALKQATQQCEQNAMPISFLSTGEGTSSKNTDHLAPSFMYTQILKEILLTIDFKKEHFQEFIDHCYQQFSENNDHLNDIKKLEQTYRDKMPIWWYTYDSFLYSMLNRALRIMDADVIVKMGFFIVDLHRHIEELHSKQVTKQNFNKSFIVYRGQGMTKDEFEEMKRTKGGLAAFNNFLSTTKNRDISLRFTNDAIANPDLVGILFVMTIDPSKSRTPFASVDGISYFPTEDEILFSMHTVFRIHDIKPMDGNHRIFEVNLTLTSDNDKDLCALTDLMRKETKGPSGWYRLGELLRKMGEMDKAQQIFITLFGQTKTDLEKAPIYHQLGLMKSHQGEYKEAIIKYEKSLEIYERILPSNHVDLAGPYTNIGLAYSSMGQHLKALSSHKKALEIRKQSLPSNHPDLAASYNNIGVIYGELREYPEAHSNLEEAHKIKKVTLPSNHPDLAASYNNIGIVCLELKDYSKALSSEKQALEIYERTLPSNHPNLATVSNNIGVVCERMHDYPTAHSYYKRAVEIGQESLPSDNRELQNYQKNLEHLKKKMQKKLNIE